MRLGFLISILVSTAAGAEPLGLPQLIERARRADPRVKEAEAQLRFYRAKYAEARWSWFPRLDSYFLVAGPMPEARNNGLGGPPTTPATLNYDLDFGTPGVMLRAGVEAIVPVYTFGKIAALEEAGKHGVEAGLALRSRAEDEAEYQVSVAYWAYCLAEEGAKVLEDTAARLDEAARTLSRLREQGSEQVTQMDVYKLGYYRNQLQAQVAAATSGRQYALAAIRVLIAAPPEEVVEVEAQPLPEPSGTLLTLDVYQGLAEENRPELKAVAAGVAARLEEVRLRERMYLPDIGLAGFFRWAYTTSSTRQLSPFAFDPYNELSAGVGVALRYQFDFPQKGILLEQARAEYQKTQHQRDLAVAGVRLEIHKAWSDVKAALERAERQSTAEKDARRWATSAYAAFDLGTADTRELVDAFTALAASGAQRAQAFHDVQVGLKGLSRAVGLRVTLGPPAAPGEEPAN